MGLRIHSGEFQRQRVSGVQCQVTVEHDLLWAGAWREIHVLVRRHSVHVFRVRAGMHADRPA